MVIVVETIFMTMCVLFKEQCHLEISHSICHTFTTDHICNTFSVHVINLAMLHKFLISKSFHEMDKPTRKSLHTNLSRSAMTDC